MTIPGLSSLHGVGRIISPRVLLLESSPTRNFTVDKPPDLRALQIPKLQHGRSTGNSSTWTQHGIGSQSLEPPVLMVNGSRLWKNERSFIPSWNSELEQEESIPFIFLHFTPTPGNSSWAGVGSKPSLKPGLKPGLTSNWPAWKFHYLLPHTCGIPPWNGPSWFQSRLRRGDMEFQIPTTSWDFPATKRGFNLSLTLEEEKVGLGAGNKTVIPDFYPWISFPALKKPRNRCFPTDHWHS